MKEKILIATRGSKLSLIQATSVKNDLEKIYGKDFEFELKTIKTTGDKLQSGGIKSDKGLFTKELEESLHRGDTHLAVHSCKDLPTVLEKGFCIAAVQKRLSPMDVLVLKKNYDRENLPAGAIILTSSPRREKQWLEKFPQTRTEPIRGNVDTRLKKLSENKKALGLILAEAGLQRLVPDLSEFQVIPFSLEEMMPAPGQGALAIETLTSDAAIFNMVQKLNDSFSEKQIIAERKFLSEMGGGCRSAIGAYAELVEGGKLKLHGYVHSEEGGIRKNLIREDPESLAKELAKEFL